MRFLIFLNNMVVGFIGFFLSILVEITIFGILYLSLEPVIGEFWSSILGIVFVAWVIVDTILRIVIGSSASILKYLFSFTQ